MGQGTPGRDLKRFVFIILFVMILMRLVWMQLRSYPVTIHPRAALSIAAVESGSPLVRSPTYRDSRNMPPLESPLLRITTGALWETGAVAHERFVRMNQWLVAAIALLSVMLTRFISGSWLYAMAVGAALMSRGRLIAAVGEVGTQLWLSAFSMLWLSNVAHFIRSGASIPLVVSFGAMLVLAWADWSMMGLFLVWPLVLALGFSYRSAILKPAMARLKADQGLRRKIASASGAEATEGPWAARWRFITRWLPEVEKDYLAGAANLYQQGTLLRTLAVPFPLWIYNDRRWVRLIGLSLAGLLITVGGLVGWYISHNAFAGTGKLSWLQAAGQWSNVWLGAIDLDLALALGLLVSLTLQKPGEGLRGFWECNWVLLAGVVVVSACAFFLDRADFAILQSRQDPSWGEFLMGWGRAGRVLLWFEPALLTLGFVGVLQVGYLLRRRMAGESGK